MLGNPTAGLYLPMCDGCAAAMKSVSSSTLTINNLRLLPMQYSCDRA